VIRIFAIAIRLQHQAFVTSGSRTDDATSPDAGIAGYCLPGGRKVGSRLLLHPVKIAGPVQKVIN
jgi:hypothetical protein